MYKEYLGFGIAGNFANHLEQAGEANDFIHIKGDSEDAPKGIFPFYIPENSGFLGRYCINNDELVLPQNPKLKVQAEPEVALECELVYKDNVLLKLIPKYFMAFNDASVRNDENAQKISQKKNFSRASKAVGHKKIAIDKFEDGGICDNYSIASFIKSKGVLESYGELSTFKSYSYFYERLSAWIVKKINTQQDFAVLENLSTLIQNANYPRKLLIAIGATRYVKENENRTLEPDDRVCIVVFNHHKYSFEEIQKLASKDFIPKDLEELSIINQRVVLE